MRPKAPPFGHIKDSGWVGVRTPPILWQLGFPEHLPGLACCRISPSALQGQAGAACSGLLRSGPLFSFQQCQGCSPLPGPDQPWESGYLGCEGLSLRGLNKKPLNTLKLREVSNLSADPHSRPLRDGLGSVPRYRGFLISPSSDKLLIKRAFPPIFLLSLLPLPGDPREGLKVASARRGLRVIYEKEGKKPCWTPASSSRGSGPRSRGPWRGSCSPGTSSSRYQRLSSGSEILRGLRSLATRLRNGEGFV